METWVTLFGAELEQVLHGCRQLVPWGVGLSPITSETFILSCQHVMVGTLGRLPTLSGRKVETTSSHHGPYVQGYTRATMVDTKGSEVERRSKSRKVDLSSDWRLKFAFMKLESLVIVGQQYHGECVPEPCTHRPSSHWSRGSLKSLTQPQGGRCPRNLLWQGLSRNKVAVGEPVAGSPPF